MKRFKKYKPYVRLANGREKATNWRDAIRLAFYQNMGKPFYVMVQHGFPNVVIAVGANKREVQQSLLVVKAKRKTFRQWSRDVQIGASGKRKVMQ